VSLYQLHRCVWDFVRAGEISSGEYELTDEERRAFERKDPAALYRLGLHPVLLHGFCRAVGYQRDDYRRLLVAAEPVPAPVAARTGRWQR
jgi:hypothetical protein